MHTVVFHPMPISLSYEVTCIAELKWRPRSSGICLVYKAQKAFNWATFFGGGAVIIAFTLDVVECRPSAVIWCPRYSTAGRKNIHLLCFSRKPAAPSWTVQPPSYPNGPYLNFLKLICHLNTH